MKFIAVEERNDFGDVITEEFNNPIDAVNQLESWFSYTTLREDKSRSFYVLESANPDEEAENHSDGNEIFRVWNIPDSDNVCSALAELIFKIESELRKYETEIIAKYDEKEKTIIFNDIMHGYERIPDGWEFVQTRKANPDAMVYFEDLSEIEFYSPDKKFVEEEVVARFLAENPDIEKDDNCYNLELCNFVKENYEKEVEDAYREWLDWSLCYEEAENILYRFKEGVRENQIDEIKRKYENLI